MIENNTALTTDFVTALVAILLEDRVIDQKRADQLIKEFKGRSQGRFEEFVLDQGLLEKDDLLQALSEYYGVPSFDCAGYFFERRYLQMFPKDVLLRHAIIPLPVSDAELSMIFVANTPYHPDLFKIIGDHVSYDVQFYVGLERDITDAISEYYDESDTEDYNQFGESV